MQIDELDLASIGPQFESHEVFPAKTNTEFVEVCCSCSCFSCCWQCHESYQAGQQLVLVIKPMGLANRSFDRSIGHVTDQVSSRSNLYLATDVHAMSFCSFKAYTTHLTNLCWMFLSTTDLHRAGGQQATCADGGVGTRRWPDPRLRHR